MACAAVGPGLGPSQQAGLLLLLRVVSDGERLCEDARARLCEAHEFDPQRVFQQLQGASGGGRGPVGPAEVHHWLARSPHVATTVSLENLVEALRPYLNSHGDLGYEGFLKMCVPRDPSRSWLKQVALSRSAQAAWSSSGSDSADVVSRLCQLLEREWNMRSLITMHHRGNPALQAMAKADIAKFLDAEAGACAGMGDFVSPEAVRRTLVDKLSALSSTQCDSLMRRLNPSGLCLIALSELAMHVLPSPACQPSPPSCAGALCGASPLRDSSALSSTRLGTSWAQDAALGLDAARVPSPPPRLREPAGPQDWRWPLAAGRREPVPSRLQYDDPNRDAIFDARVVPAGAREEADLPCSGSAPLLAFFLRDGRPEPQRGGGASVSQSWEQRLHRSPDLARDWSPQWRAAPSSPPRRQESPGRASSLPPGKSLAAAARAARAPAASCRGPPAMAPAGGFGAPALVPPASCSVLAPGRGGAAPALARPAPAPLPTASPPSARCPPLASSSASGSAAGRVLKAMARQAWSDAQVEEAKLLLPAGLPLEAVFRTLDRANKGFVLDSDLLCLLRHFGGSPASGSLVALVRDLQLRLRFDPVALPGQLSFREVGSLVFPVGSQEHEALCAAVSDAEARSILYLLKNSEPCPRCGMRAQRDADAAGCPSVTCPVCGASFRCFTVVGDAPSLEPVGLSPSSSYHLFRLIDVAARAASDVEAERARLASQPGFGICTLSDAFGSLAGERASFRVEDLRRALARHGVPVTEAELGLLWARYAPHGAASVSFPDFARQLRGGSPY